MRRVNETHLGKGGMKGGGPGWLVCKGDGERKGGVR